MLTDTASHTRPPRSTLSRRRALQILAGTGVVGAAAAVGVGALILADRLGADSDEGRPLYRSSFGEGDTTIAFLPGHGATTRYFESRVAPLAARHRLLFVDLLGFGHSPKPWVEYTVDRHIADLRRVLAPSGPLTLVGHSLGARLAVTYAARYPNQVRQLVLFSLPHFEGRDAARRHVARGSRPGRWLSTQRTLAIVTCVLLRHVLSPWLSHLDPDMPREVLDDVRLHHWQSDVSTLWRCIYEYDLTADIERLRADLPVRCVHGNEDTSAPLSGVARFAAIHRATSLRILTGVDHHPLLRAAGVCLEEIEDAMRAVAVSPTVVSTAAVPEA